MRGVRDLIVQAPRFTEHQRTAEWVAKAEARTQTLLKFADIDDPDFLLDLPRPEPVMRITPKF